MHGLWAFGLLRRTSYRYAERARRAMGRRLRLDNLPPRCRGDARAIPSTWVKAGCVAVPVLATAYIRSLTTSSSTWTPSQHILLLDHSITAQIRELKEKRMAFNILRHFQSIIEHRLRKPARSCHAACDDKVVSTSHHSKGASLRHPPSGERNSPTSGVASLDARRGYCQTVECLEVVDGRPFLAHDDA